MEKKAQSSIEYLATYGWALLLMFLVIAFLVGSGVFNPSRFASEECTFQPNLPCTQYYAQAIEGRAQAKISFNLTNTMGFPIAILGVNSDSEGVKSSCANCKRYLLQGESATFTFEPSTSREYYDNEMLKLKFSLQFRGCKGIDEATCLNNVNLSRYTTSGRIYAALRGTTTGSSSLCTSADNKCSGTVLYYCSGGSIISRDCAVTGGTCTGSGTSAACTSSSCTSADDFCDNTIPDNNILNFCSGGSMVSTPCADVCSQFPSPHCAECLNADTRCGTNTRSLETCIGESWQSEYCQNIGDASKEYCSDFAGTPQCVTCLSDKIKCASGSPIAYLVCDEQNWMLPPTHFCSPPTPVCKDGGPSADDYCSS